MAARMRVCERLRRVRFYGAERTRYARANTLLTDFAYHWPPRGHACCRGSLDGGSAPSYSGITATSQERGTQCGESS